MLSSTDHPAVASVEHRLRSSGYSSLRNLKVTKVQNQILLAGKVPTYYLKQVASVLATTAVEGHVIRNEVVVT
jgi:hypothetical protein